VHVALFPSVTEVLGSTSNSKEFAPVAAHNDLLDQVRKDWNQLMVVREQVLKALEGARQSKQIRSALEAKVTISAPSQIAELLRHYLETLKALFIVSQLEVHESQNGQGLSVRVMAANGKKCERCWNYSVHVGENERFPTVCERCTAALEEILRNRSHA